MLDFCTAWVYYNYRNKKTTNQINQEGMDMTTLEIRYERAIKKIGGASALIELPKQIKDVLKNTKDLQTKVKMLEEIAKAK